MSTLYKECQGSNAKSCLTADLQPQSNRPSTPPEQQKYRRSTYLEPGKRFQHYGIADDIKQLGLERKVFGVQSDRGNGTAADVINTGTQSTAERLNQIKAELIYKSTTQEPLGSRMDRKVKMPSKFTEAKVPFGMPTKSSADAAKEIMFPTTIYDNEEGDNLYRRSHGSYGPGEQKLRNYQWPLDPNQAVFGRKAGTSALNGASTNIAEVLKGSSKLENPLVSKKSVEDFRNTGDVLGMSRNLGQDSASRPFDMIYGQSSAAILKAKRVHTAAEVIKGNYNLEQQLPDKDLGKSIMPGFRNITNEDRAFGCPSIRTDLQSVRQARRSVSDCQNYGDDVPAKFLINPPPFADLSIGPDAMKTLKNKEKIYHIFDQIGYSHIHPNIREVIFHKASGGDDKCSVNSYRNALNEYLDAIETNEEEAWLYQNGLLLQ